MFTKRTIIGTVVGGAIIALGLASFIMSLGLQTVEIDDTYGIGEGTSYRFSAPSSSEQNVKITGESFDVTLSTPADGLQIPLTEHKNEVTFQWFHLADGESKLEVQNTGQKELHITGTVQISTDPIYYTYHVLVMISGIVIIGFSAGFSIRKPRGF